MPEISKYVNKHCTNFLRQYYMYLKMILFKSKTYILVI